MEGKIRKKSKHREDTASNGRDSEMVAGEGILSKVGYGVESRLERLKKRKRTREVEDDGDNDQVIIGSKKKDTSLRDKEVEDDGPCGHATQDQVPFHGKVSASESEITPAEKKKKDKRRRERDGSGGHAYNGDLEAVTARDQVVVRDQFHNSGHEVSQTKKKKGKKSRRDDEAEVPRSTTALNGFDGVSFQSDVQDGVGCSDIDSLPAKKRKGKKRRGNRETEAEFPENQGDSCGGGVRKQAVLQHGVGDNNEDPSPTKKKEGKRSPRKREVAGEGLGDNSDLEYDGGRGQGVLEDGVGHLDVHLVPTKTKKRKKNRGGKEVECEGNVSSSDSDGDRVTNLAVVLSGSNESGLEVSPARKKKGRKSHIDKEMDGESQSDSDIAGVQNEIVSRCGAVESDGRLSAIKKIKKTVRFQEPEIHWREEEEGEEHLQEEEEDVRSEDHQLDDEEYSSAVSDDEVFPDTFYEGTRGWIADSKRRDLKYGFFTKEEDEKLKTAVYDYIKAKNWGESEGLDMLLHSRAHAEARGAWLDIAKSLPHRPVKMINSRAQRLLSTLKRGTWSQEELEKLKQLQELHGHDWKAVEKEMGRPAQLCKDKWRVLRLAPVLKKGRFSEEELDRLSMYVRWSLKLKERLKKKELDRRILRDDINWETIAEKMGRTSATCSVVWYQRLASSLITQGNWANGDDRRLLRSLMETGASSEEAVDWDDLLSDRDGLTCERRWYQMIRLLPERGEPFEDKLEQLIKRYAPDLIGLEDDFDMGDLGTVVAQ